MAEAAVVLAESAAATIDRVDMIESGKALAEGATRALAEPAKLHGVDQLMLGHAQAVAGDADVQLQRIAYHASDAEAA